MSEKATEAEVVYRWYNHPAKGPVKARFVLRFHGWHGVDQYLNVDPVGKETWPTREEIVKYHLDMYGGELDVISERYKQLKRKVSSWTRYAKK